MGANTKQASGFTLVEISIVMIIIGLLIGGTFGGMKLIDNMQVNKTVQDLKAVESAALTFKDTYGRLPGDMPNTAARLPNCTDAPCATGGNGDRRIGTPNLWLGAITSTSENFAFWAHLQAADLVSLGVKNTLDMTFGEGQPESAVGGGMRITDANYAPQAGAATGCTMYNRSILILTGEASGNTGAVPTNVPVIACSKLGSIDRKIDDNSPSSGLFQSYIQCYSASHACPLEYNPSGIGYAYYDLKGF